MITIQNLKDDGSLHYLKWMLIGSIVFALLGAAYATIKVVYFEQDSLGAYSYHNECVLWDEEYVQSCKEAAMDNPESSISCNGGCLEYSTISEPIGKRLKDLIFKYAIISGGAGVTIGIIIAENKKK